MDRDRYRCVICGRMHPVGWSHDEYIEEERISRGYEQRDKEWKKGIMNKIRRKK